MSAPIPPTPPQTAWQSLPAPIRFAVWVWAIGTIAIALVGWLVAVLVWGLN
ncbi:hypothetical protein [Kribbella sp.]|uniref:hypothetical protein n=1 Tax=Kribbella sp. TaxID=1871183 RepID=UPI002D58E4DC|nr:hypothetical protein [Kribbella sp.]HZX05671.1 hypothetical protein [Kribbella sp.]